MSDKLGINEYLYFINTFRNLEIINTFRKILILLYLNTCYTSKLSSN